MFILISASPLLLCILGLYNLKQLARRRLAPVIKPACNSLFPRAGIWRYLPRFSMPRCWLSHGLKLHGQIEIAQGSRSVDSELYANGKLGRLIRSSAESLHVHDASTSASMPGGDWEYYLKRCHVERCPKLDTVFSSTWYDFVPLENFWASDLLVARCIWSKGYRAGRNHSFRNLQHLHLCSCPRLQYVIPVCVSSFPSLETLHIIHCGDLRHVFVLNERRSPEAIVVHSVAFPKLTTIHLHDLPTLRQICEVKMVAPALETIRIRGCWSLQQLPYVEKKPTVKIEKDVWDALEWDGVVAGHHPGLFEAPIHSCYYKKKLPRVSVLRCSAY